MLIQLSHCICSNHAIVHTRHTYVHWAIFCLTLHFPIRTCFSIRLPCVGADAKLTKVPESLTHQDALPMLAQCGIERAAPGSVKIGTLGQKDIGANTLSH